MIHGLMPDHRIRDLALRCNMIEPFIEHRGERRVGEISCGLSSYGYDARLGYDFKMLSDIAGVVVDPKRMDPKCFVDRSGDFCIVPPNSFVLGTTIERFKIPSNVLCVCLGKSTYARCGIIVNVTPLEPGWEGQVTIEISNTTRLPAKVYAGEGICQIIFFEGSSLCEAPYPTRSGKYQGQLGVTIAKM